MSALSDRVREARERAGITPAELARRAGVSQAAISKIESGQTKTLKASTVMAIAAATDCSASWLESGKGDAVEAAPSFEDSPFSMLSREEKRDLVMRLLPELSREDKAAALRFLLTQ